MTPDPKRKTNGAQVSRPPLERMQRIHRAVQAGEYPNCSTLAKTMEVAKKTIQRDIEFMRDRQNLPIEFSHQKNGYYITIASPYPAFRRCK